MSRLYVREWTAARQRVKNATPDIFAENRFKIFGIRRALQKLGASPAGNLERLNAHELEKLRGELAAQLSSRHSRDNPAETTKLVTTRK
jgi:hypothetical protein